MTNMTKENAGLELWLSKNRWNKTFSSRRIKTMIWWGNSLKTHVGI